MISVCMPVHITHVNQIHFLQTAITSYIDQKHLEKELIISDDIGDSVVESIVNSYRNWDKSIKYVKSSMTGISHNLNNSVSYATGNILKFLFQDDYFASDNSLKSIEKRLMRSRQNWLITATKHLFQSVGQYRNPHFPFLSDKLLEGINTISSPSVIAVKNESFLEFCSELDFLMDCEWYLRMYHKKGSPVFLNKIQIINRIHDSQATNWARHKLDLESKIAMKMHSNHKMNRSACTCMLN